MENWTVKSVDGEEPKSAQEKEQAVVEAAVADSPNVEIQGEGDVIKVNLDQPVAEAEVPQEEPVVEVAQTEEANATQEEENTEAQEQDVTQESEDNVIELIQDDTPQGEQLQQNNEAGLNEEPQDVAPVVPEGLENLVKFMDETGGTLEDYVSLNRDLDQLSPVDLISDYYKKKYPHYNDERIQRKMNKEFAYDADADEPDAIQDKKDSFEDTLFEAKRFLGESKEKYYNELKFNRSQSSSSEVKEATEFYTDYKKSQENNERLSQEFKQSTDQFFNEDFKGFDFKVGDSKYRFKVQDTGKVKEYQSDLNNFISDFAGEDGVINDTAGYHKALFAAKNADKIAQHFYEQGRAEAIKSGAKQSKNIDMNPRGDAGSMVQTKTGTQFKVVSGDSSNSLKFKIRK